MVGEAVDDYKAEFEKLNEDMGALVDERDHYRAHSMQLEEALQLCLMRFKECGAKGHDRVIHMITKLLTKK